VWVGESTLTEPSCEMVLIDEESEDTTVELVEFLLQDKGMVLHPW